MKIKFYIIALLILATLTSCVQEVHLKTVTFKVNMINTEQPINVGVKGDFTENRWNETIPLTDENNDGIYEVTVSQKTAINQIQFKFVNNEEYELKEADNRVLEFEYKPETIIYETTFNNPESKITKE
ncbi:hypothetical protein [Winogradskyella poriferorum]|uniref:hypothetical protein n=1 Tax=Winogradskyella poriferorum TaxID=307627 RepID=UPI003D64E413